MYMYIAQHLPCLFWQLPALIIASTTKSSQIGPTIYLLLCMLDSNVLDSAQINWSWCFAIGEMVCLFCCVGVMVFFILICHCPLHHWALAHLTIGIQSNHPPTRMYWMHNAYVLCCTSCLPVLENSVYICVYINAICVWQRVNLSNELPLYRYVCGSCAVMYVNLRVYTTLTAIHFSLFMSSFQLCIFWWLYWESEEEFSRQLLVTSHYWCQHRRYLYHRWWKGGLLTHSPILVGNIFRRSMRWIFSPKHCLLEDSTHNSVT